MKLSESTLACVVGLVSVLVLPCYSKYQFVELSHVQNTETIYWPGVPSFNRTRIFGETNNHGIWIEVGVYTSGEHGGTHIDAPRHFFQDGLDLASLPLDRLVAEGVNIDCTQEAASDPDYGATLAKVQQWEAENGRIPNEATVLFYFGYAQKFSNPTAYLGSNNVNDPLTFHFPYVTIEAIKWLIANRNIKSIGLDTPSPDAPTDTTFPVHLELLPRNSIIMENVNIPRSLPPRNFRVHAAPIRTQDGTGVQTRIYAMLYDRVTGGGKGLGASAVSVVAIAVGGFIVGMFASRREC